ncbi:MAG: glutamyl-tRNA reductase [Clostridium sp.]
MNINMIGIDHNLAPVNIREKVALTKTKLINSLKNIKKNYILSGLVIISTCNRSEIWFSGYGDLSEIEDIVSREFNVSRDFVNRYFVKRSGREAIEHIFSLSSGVESRIIGEDQIITQVRQSADLAREYKTIDSTLEKLFRLSVTAGKRVKTNIRLQRASSSIGESVIQSINNEFNRVCSCLVIGNGEIGKTCAKALINNGHRVYMTTRRYKNGESSLIEGAIAIDYEDRYKYINQDVIVSGTLSPHYTLTLDRILQEMNNEKRVFIDLAMPRDIDPLINGIKDIKLYDIDSLSVDNRKLYREYSSDAYSIYKGFIDEFYEYYYTRDIRKGMYISKGKVGSII